MAKRAGREETTADVERLIYEAFRNGDPSRAQMMPLIRRWQTALGVEHKGERITPVQLQAIFVRMLRAAQAGGQGWEDPSRG